MTTLACMTSGDPVEVETPERDDDTILLVQHGQVVGVLSEDAQRDVKTLRLTLTRQVNGDRFQPLQGVSVEMF